MWLFSENAAPVLITLLLLVQVVVFHLVFPYRNEEKQHDCHEDESNTRRSDRNYQTQTVWICNSSRLDEQTESYASTVHQEGFVPENYWYRPNTTRRKDRGEVG
jgi:hypothetical protein